MQGNRKRSRSPSSRGENLYNTGKEWMKAPRSSSEYLEGVDAFIEFIGANAPTLVGEDWYCCPCVKCRNVIGGKKKIRDIRTHLMCDGIDKSYTTWIHHGENHPQRHEEGGVSSKNDDSDMGQARVAEDMRQENPGVEIIRTDVFLRTHTKKDGSVTCPKDAVRSLHEANRSLAQQDLNNDPVAKLIGRDSRGCVRGLGMGVSQTSISYSAPYMKALADEKSSHEKIENKMVQLMEETGGLRKEIDELKQSLSQGGTLMRSSTHHLHYSQARNDSPHQETRTNQASEQTGMTMRQLMHLVQKDVCIAYGTVIGSSLEYPGCYRIVVEEILDYSAQLVNGHKTFGDLTLGDMIDWPMYKTLD